MIARAGFALGRGAAAVCCLATWAYAITTYSPFAFDMFVRPQLFAPLTTFVAWHFAFYWLAFAASAATLVPDIRQAERPAVRWAAMLYVLVFAGLGFVLLGDPYLARLSSESRSSWAVYGALLPLAWLAVIDHLSADAATLRGRGRPATSQTQLAGACSATAVVLWLSHAVAAAVGGRLPADAGIVATTLTWALTLDLSGMLLICAAFTLITAVASVAQRRFAWEFYLAAGALAIAVTEIWRRVILPAFSFSGADAAPIACALGVTIAASWSGLRARSQGPDNRSAIDVLFAVALRRRALAVPAMVAICAIAATLTTLIAAIDWAHLLHTAIAIGEAALIFGFFMALFRRPAEAHWPWKTAVAAPLLAIAALHALPLAQTRLAAATGNGQLDPRAVVDRLVSADPLAAFAAERLIELPAFDLDYFQALLASETSQPAIDPAVPALSAVPSGRAAARPPHVFVFVIDSLRRDYLSPYNPAVTFTPSIDAWARDGFVFENAFTPYGGTWLSMPSLWTGGAVPRGWARILAGINALDAGVTAAGYDFVINDFTVADQLPATTPRTFLDPDIPSGETDLCRNVESLSAHLSARRSRAPVFAFLAPMNVHILNTGTNSSEGRGRYPGFYPPYAARLERLDRCFGAFIDDLERRGIYDDSLIVLTSDHGDSLGESGRWGHQFYLFPETIRIPLIVQLPRDMRETMTTDLSRMSLLTDVAPTVIDAIGQPFMAHRGSGAPLFVPADREPAQRRRESQLLMSSYGSTYGLLRRNGRQLYISDLRNWREYAFLLDSEPAGRAVPVTGAMRRVNQRLIREQVAAREGLFRR